MEKMLKDSAVEAVDPAVFRSPHTIKSGAVVVNVGSVVSACHLTDNLFDAIHSGHVPMKQATIDAALKARGFVADQLARLASSLRIENLRPLPARLEQMLLTSIKGAA